MYENGCLSSSTRGLLLERKIRDAHFFQDAKYEVANDIATNPALRKIVDKFAAAMPSAQRGSPEAHMRG